MITEDFCSLEVAKLLKEKGFDELCIFKYSSEGVRMKAGVSIDEWQNSELDDDECSCVSHQMAMKWLREVHNIHIVVHPYTDKEGHHFSFLFDSYAYGCWQELGIYITDSWSTYEEACEAAIKYCLENLI